MGTPGAGRTPGGKGRGSCRVGARVGVPVVLSVVATVAGNAPRARQGRTNPAGARLGGRSWQQWVGVFPSCVLGGSHCGRERPFSAFCMPVGPSPPAGMGKGRVHELHPRNLVGCMDFKPWWPPRQQRRGEGTLLHFHVRICGCPAAWAFSWGPCGRKVWCFGTE